MDKNHGGVGEKEKIIHEDEIQTLKEEKGDNQRKGKVILAGQ